MDETKTHYLITIVGPTAIGKTELAIKLATFFNTEIISADSRQFFREISIGTAKPSVTELDTVKHHFINSHSIHDSINVGDFEQEVINLLTDLFRKNQYVVMVGGSGLYIDAVCNGLDQLPKRDEKLRKELTTYSLESLQKELQELDPEYYKEVDIQNPHRLMRAIEVCKLTGKTYTSFRKGISKKRNFHTIKIGLNIDRELLYNRINSRVDNMINTGLLEEAKSVYHLRELNALQTVGYSELFDYIDGKLTLEEAVALIKQNTRRFAKRQLTWFNRDEFIKWFNPEDESKIIDYIQSKTELKNKGSN